ncbi:MAG: hypothetical protein AB1510_12660 [Bacillota bacterium]
MMARIHFKLLKKCGVTAFVIVLLGLTVAAAAVIPYKPPVVANDGSGEYINPGAPLGLRNFFEGAGRSENPSLQEVLNRVRYPLLLRYEGDQLITPSRIFVQMQVLRDGRLVEGFTFLYADRIQVCVDPMSEPLNIDEMVSWESSVRNIKGETKCFFKTKVRNVEASGRESGVQKWASGAENHYPAVIEWSEKVNGDIPYVKYALVGNGPVSELIEMAASLKLTEKGNEIEE